MEQSMANVDRILTCVFRVKNANHAFLKIYREGGVRALWKGAIPNMQRAALVNLGDLTTYDMAKRTILDNTKLEDSHLVHIMSRYLTIPTCLAIAFRNSHAN